MVGHLDGEAGEAALTEELLPKMAGAAGVKWVVRDWIWLYCNLGVPGSSEPVVALIRYCSNTAFVADPTRAARESRDAREKRQLIQKWGGWARPRATGRPLRRITLHLADGKQLGVITDLLDETAFPAEDMLATYHKRWGIETVFHQITDVFSLRHLIGSSPQAVLFQFSLCLLMYNTLQVLRAHLADHQKCEAKKISNEKLFYDVERQMVSLSEVVEVDTLLDLLGEVPSAAELRDYLRDLRDRRAISLVENKVRVAAGTKASAAFLAIIRRLTGSFSKQKATETLNHHMPLPEDLTARLAKGGRGG